MTEVVVKMPKDAALVPVALVSRIGEDASFPCADQAQQRILWNLEAGLESARPAILAAEYATQPERTGDNLRDDVSIDEL